MKQALKTGVGRKRNNFECNQTILDQRERIQRLVCFVSVPAFEDENSFFSIVTEIELTENAIFVEFPGTVCLRLKMGGELLVIGPRELLFECENFHGVD